jgi:hypothetical protein
MKIIGSHFHMHYQQIAMMDETTGELIERRAGRPHRERRSALGAQKVPRQATNKLLAAFQSTFDGGKGVPEI